MGKLYNTMIPKIQKSPMVVNTRYAVFSYLLLCFAMNYFVLPNIKKNTLKELINHGFLLGIVIYGVYDFTAAAVLKSWDEKTMYIDVLWGGILFTITPYLTNLFLKTINIKV